MSIDAILELEIPYAEEHVPLKKNKRTTARPAELDDK